MGLYCWELLGHADFASLPDASPDVRLDSHAWLCLWSRSLILDHVHQWATCRHDRTSGRASHDICLSVSHMDSGGSHIICAICGEERFDPQPMVDRARRMLEKQA